MCLLICYYCKQCYGQYWATYLRQVVIILLPTISISDDSTGNLELSDEGLIGRVLLIVTESIELPVLFAIFILSLLCVGKH